MSENEVKYNAIISSYLNKIIPFIAAYSNKNKTKRHYINSNGFWHMESENGEHLICVSPEKLKSINIKFSKLWIDKNIPKDVIDKIILNKYIGKKEDIIHI